MRLLILNPNTSAAVTTRLLGHAQAHLASRALARPVTLLATTAQLGASYIASEASYAIAGHAALDAWARFARSGGQADALLLGCFGDPGVAALREVTGLPVIGLAEAALRQAVRHGRVAVVTGGLAWVPMLQRLARSLGLGQVLVGVHAVAPSGAELAANPAAALALLAQACRSAARGADALILGGAGLAGLAGPLAGALAAQPGGALGLPLIDSSSAGLDWLLDEPWDDLRQAPAPGSPPVWSGLQPALQQTLGQAGTAGRIGNP